MAESLRTVDPQEKQREMRDILSQETRHRVIQVVLGHPDYLPSLDELNYMIPEKGKSAVRNAALTLCEEGILAQYRVSDEALEAEGQSPHNRPQQFFGPTEDGVRTLSEFNYLRTVPVLRALYDQTTFTGRIDRHRTAVRPDLPEAVAAALEYESQTAEELDAGDGESRPATDASWGGAGAADAASEVDDDAFSDLF